MKGGTPRPKTRHGHQSPDTHPKSTLWNRSSELGHSWYLPPKTLRATAHTHRVSVKDFLAQMAHFLLCRGWVWNGQCELHSFHWQIFAKQPLLAAGTNHALWPHGGGPAPALGGSHLLTNPVPRCCLHQDDPPLLTSRPLRGHVTQRILLGAATMSTSGPHEASQKAEQFLWPLP